MLSQTPEAIEKLKQEREQQISYWKTTGVLKFELDKIKKEALKNEEINIKKEEKKVTQITGTKPSSSPMIRRKTNIANLQSKLGNSSGIKRRFSQIIGEFHFCFPKPTKLEIMFFFIESPPRRRSAGTNASSDVSSKQPLKRRKSVSTNLVSNKKMSLVVTKVNTK